MARAASRFWLWTFPLVAGTAAALVLDDVVVARRLCIAVAPPPFRGDALRPFDPQHAMRHAPPDEAKWRTVGHFGHDGNLLGAIE